MVRCIVLLCTVLVVGCTSIPEGQFWVYQWDFPNEGELLGSVSSTYWWIVNNLDYQEDVFYEWKTPKETYEDGGGDCEDLALFMMYLVWKYTESEPFMMIIRKSGVKHHAIVRVKNMLYDPKGSINVDILNLDFKIIREYNYGQAMYRALFER